jgi:hypothetical protein
MHYFYFSNNSGDPGGDPFIKDDNISVKNVLFEPLDQNKEYPENLSYHICGKESEYHIPHILTKSPNFQQENDVSLSDDAIDMINKMNDPITRISIPS